MHFGCASKSSVVYDEDLNLDFETKKSALGSDISPYAISYPDAEWIPIEAPLLSPSLVATAGINGTDFKAILDTGAGLTLIPYELIEPLGLKNAVGTQTQIVDSQGNTLPVIHIDAAIDVSLGKRVIKSTQVHIALSQTPRDRQSVALIGADVLSQVDLLIDPEAGVIGLFDAAKAPKEKGDRIISTVGEALQMRALAKTFGATGTIRFEMVVDTGSSGSGIPRALAKQKNVPIDMRYQDTQYSLVSSQTRQGRFSLSTLELGPEHVRLNDVLALQNDSENAPL